MSRQKKKVALIGNPNSGKSSLFNILTGLRQQVGNFPGVTVDKKIGSSHLTSDLEVNIIDFPGTYSLYPNSSDEKIVIEILSDPDNQNYPDAIIYILDINNLERHLLLASQLIDLNIPMVIAMNMLDLAEKHNVQYDELKLTKKLGVQCIPISCRTGQNLDQLKMALADILTNPVENNHRNFYRLSKTESKLVKEMNGQLGQKNDYQKLLSAHHVTWLKHLKAADRITINSMVDKHGFESIKSQINETMTRFNKFTPFVQQALVKENNKKGDVTDKIDQVITHRFLGPIIFFVLMLLVFQAIFAWSEYPMTLIEEFFAWAESNVSAILPDGWFSRLLTEGVIAGLGGIMVFIPQIAFLFLLVSILEEIGYMSRAVFMFDRLLQRFGLNGRSIVSLVSGGACAIPAIMSTRTIGNWRERLITIMVTPLISCSARIPVYTVLIGFIVPQGTLYGLNQQGLAFMGLYLLSIIAALMAAYVFNLILKKEEGSFLMMELPIYKPPIWKNVLLNLKEKVGTFIIEAGKIILVISIILWFMASYGPPGKMAMAEEKARIQSEDLGYNELEKEQVLASLRMEESYAGHLGKFIEPVIEPLGFDWKMGIALITSFAAREVFVGTMATIYSIGNTEDELTVRQKMASEINPKTGKPVYGFATALSLLIFYVFAMQCMSTLAITKRETKSWKWPTIQFVYMTAMAYLGSLIVFQLFS